MKKTILKENCWGMLVPMEIDDESQEINNESPIVNTSSDNNTEEDLVTLEDIVLEVVSSDSKVLKKDIYEKYSIENEEDKHDLNEAIKEMGWESYSSNSKTYWRKKEG